jgi:hypothetical protein
MLERDPPLDDRPAACVIAQQYSSATFVSLRFQSRKEILAHLSNLYYFNILLFLKKVLNLRLLNLILCKSENMCIAGLPSQSPHHLA